MPSVNSSSVVSVLDSSTVITPSLPTLVNASPISSPISRSCAEIVATWAISFSPLDRCGHLVERGGDGLDGRVDTPLERDRVGARRDVAQAGVDHGLGEHGGGGGAVTGDVVGLGGDRLGQLGAQVLVRVVELDLAGDRDAVVGDDRRPERLVEHDVAAAGAEGDLDRVGQLVDAALQGAAGVLVEAEDLRHLVPFYRIV